MILAKRVPPDCRQAYTYDSAAAVLSGVQFGSLFPFLALIAARDLKVSHTTLSLIVAAPFLANLLAVVWARQMHGRDYLRVTVWSMAAAGGVLLFMAFASNALTYTAIILLSFIFFSASLPAYTAVLARIYPSEHRGSILAYVRVGYGLASLVVSPIAGRIIDALGTRGYRAVFPISGMFGIASALVLGRIKMPPPPPRPSSDAPPAILDSLKLLSRDKVFRNFCIAVFVCGFGNLTAQPLYALFLANEVHATNTQQGFLALISSATMMISYIWWGKYLDRVGGRFAVALPALMTAASPITYHFARNVWTLSIAAAAMGAGFAGIGLAYIAAIIQMAPEDKVHQYQAVHMTLMGIRGTIAPFVAPLLMSALAGVDSPIRYAFLACSMLILFGFLLLVRVGAASAPNLSIDEPKEAEDTIDK